MKLGIVTPVLTLLPRAHATVGGDGHLRRRRQPSCEEADRLGYHHCTCSEHVAIPAPVAETRGRALLGPAGDVRRARACTPSASGSRRTCSYSATTIRSRSRSATAPSTRSATAALILGVGVGSLREEFELLGAPFDDRGARADDAMRALRAALSEPRAGVSRTALRLHRLRGRSTRPPGAGADVGRRAHRAIASARGRARRRLGAVRPAHRRSSPTCSRAQATPKPGRHAPPPLDVMLQSEHPLDPLARTRTRRRATRAVPDDRRAPESTCASCTTPPRTTSSSSRPTQITCRPRARIWNVPRRGARSRCRWPGRHLRTSSGSRSGRRSPRGGEASGSSARHPTRRAGGRRRSRRRAG